MNIISDSSGLDLLLARVDSAMGVFDAIVNQISTSIGDEVVQQLSDAAPKGSQGGPNPPGDASGPLSQSFSSIPTGLGVDVVTEQPTKLRYVTQGTGIYGPSGGRIYPVTKLALFWPQAANPYRSVAGQHANDFVTPIIDTAPDLVGTELDAAIQEILVILE